LLIAFITRQVIRGEKISHTSQNQSKHLLSISEWMNSSNGQTFYDGEAVVTGYLPGKGKHKGATGALKCKMASGKVIFFPSQGWDTVNRDSIGRHLMLALA
jgi:hypothetical protein